MSERLFHYSAFGCSIVSELPLPELPPGPGNPEVVIRRKRVTLTPQESTPDVQIMSNTLAGRFQIAGGREIFVDALDGVDPGTVRVLLLGRVMAFLMRQRGWLPLHASAIEFAGKAALFLGASGSGKSTTAAALHARGHKVITDDVAAVRVRNGVGEVLPAWSRLRLSEEALGLLRTELPSGQALHSVLQIDKFSVNLEAQTPGQSLASPLPLSRIYILSFGDRLCLNTVPGMVAAATMSRHCFLRRNHLEPESMRLQLRDCASLAETVVTRELLRPKSVELLPALARLVEEDLDSNR